MSQRNTDIREIEQAEAQHEFEEAQADANFTKEVLKRQIDWQIYANEGKLSAKECNLILGYDQQQPDTQQDVLSEQGAAIAGLFVKMLTNIINVDTTEYTVCLLDQLFDAHSKSEEEIKAVTGYFLQYAAENPKVDIFTPFLQILTSNGQHNPFTYLRVQHILSILLSAFYDNDHNSESAMSIDDKTHRLTVVQFIRYLISKISTLSNSSPVPPSSVASVASALTSFAFTSSAAANAASSTSYSYSTSAPCPYQSVAAANRELMACLQSLKQLLKSSKKMQELFIEQDGIRALATLLNKETQNAQLLYGVGFNIWLLSFNKQAAIRLRECGVIRKLIAIVKVNVMEKVIRISFAILRNFLDHRDECFYEDMIGHGLVPVVETLQKRKFKDNDIMLDMARIQDVLYDCIKNMSTFDKYQVEVQSGALSWNNPAHKNDIFWRENINQFEAKGFALVQQLIRLADPTNAAIIAAQSSSAAAAANAGVQFGSTPNVMASISDREETIREIACHDLGEFARFHPDGKKIVHRLKGKEVLMKNLADKSPKISKAALLATQKLMVANWEYLNKSSSGGVAAIVSQQGQKKN